MGFKRGRNGEAKTEAQAANGHKTALIVENDVLFEKALGNRPETDCP